VRAFLADPVLLMDEISMASRAHLEQLSRSVRSSSSKDDHPARRQYLK